MNDTEIFLAHYGVKGMKWGVIRDREGGGDRKAARTEAKKEKFEARARDYEARIAFTDVRIKELKSELNTAGPGVKGAYNRYNLNNELRTNRDIRADYQNELDRARAGKMTQTQKNLLIGVAAVGLIGGAMYVSHMSNTGELNALRLRGEAFVKGKPFEFKKNNQFAKLNDPDSVFNNLVKGVNPNYRQPGGMMNCRRSSMAYELRRRGFDVTATTSAIGAGQSETGLINALTPGQKNKAGITSLSSMVTTPGMGIRGQIITDSRKNPASLLSIADASRYENVLGALKSQPSGSRGEIVFNFGKFGHSMSYEIFNGKPVIFDTQKATMYDLSEPFHFDQLVKKWGLPSNAEMTRLDNMDLDMNFLARWATNTK